MPWRKQRAVESLVVRGITGEKKWKAYFSNVYDLLIYFLWIFHKKLNPVLLKYFGIFSQWPFVSEFSVMQIRHLGNEEHLHFSFCSETRNILYSIWGNFQSMRETLDYNFSFKEKLFFCIKGKKENKTTEHLKSVQSKQT